MSRRAGTRSARRSGPIAVTAVLLSALLLAACAPEAPLVRRIGASPLALHLGVADVPLFGATVTGYARVAGRIVLFQGEILAAEEERLVLAVHLDGKRHMYQVRYDQLIELRLEDQLNIQTGRHAAAFLGGAVVSVPMNGLLSVFTGSFWLLGGSGVVLLEALAGSVVVESAHWRAATLRLYARFPAGLPAGWPR